MKKPKPIKISKDTFKNMKFEVKVNTSNMHKHTWEQEYVDCPICGCREILICECGEIKETKTIKHSKLDKLLMERFTFK